MKRLSLYLFLLFFTLQTPSWADDISDFQIEGMSIGDSLLDYMSKDKIKKIKSPNKKIKIVRAYKKNNLKIYDIMQSWWFDKDQEYKIVGLSGELFFDNDYEGCKKKQEEIGKSLVSMFPNLLVRKSDSKYMHDETKKSITSHYVLKFKSGDFFDVQCHKFSKNYKKKYPSIVDNLKVMIWSKEFYDHYRAAR